MAVKFTKDSYTVTVENSGAESWYNAMNDMIDLLIFCSDDLRGNNNFYYVLELMRAMLPDEKQLKQESD